MKSGVIPISVLLGLVMISAVGLIYVEHQSRKSFAQLQQLQRQLDDLDVEWGRLQLEQSAWSDHGRIEQMARERLDMRLPLPEQVTPVQP